MNRIYKVIWSKAKQCKIVVSEIAKSHLKSSETHSYHLRLLVSLLSVFSFGYYSNYFVSASSVNDSYVFSYENSVASIFSATNTGADSDFFGDINVYNSSVNNDVTSLPFSSYFVSDDDYHIVGTDRRNGLNSREHFYLYNSKNQQVADLGIIRGTSSFLNSFENFKLIKGGAYAFSKGNSTYSEPAGEEYVDVTRPVLSIAYLGDSSNFDWISSSSTSGVKEYSTDLVADKTLTVKGNTTLKDTSASNLTTDSSTTKKQTVNGDSTVTGNESVIGKSTVGSQEVTGNAETKGNQTVDGTTTLNDNTTITKGGLDVTGGTKTDSLNVTGDSSFTGNTTVNGSSEVKGSSTVDGSSTVKGNQTVDGTSHIAGDTTLKSAHFISMLRQDKLN